MAGSTPDDPRELFIVLSKYGEPLEACDNADQAGHAKHDFEGMGQEAHVSTYIPRSAHEQALADLTAVAVSHAKRVAELEAVVAELRSRTVLRAAQERVELLEQLVASAAPLTWAATSDEEGAVAWEKRAAELLAALPESTP